MKTILTYSITTNDDEPFETKFKIEAETEQDCFVKAERIIDEKYGNCGFSLIDFDYAD